MALVFEPVVVRGMGELPESEDAIDRDVDFRRFASDALAECQGEAQ